MRTLLRHNLLDRLFKNSTAQPTIVNQEIEKTGFQSEIISYFLDDTEIIFFHRKFCSQDFSPCHKT